MATNAAAAARESRRRKIVERGADRLALIKGRLPTLPPEPSDKPIADSSSQPSDSRPPSDKTNATPDDDNSFLDSMLSKDDNIIYAGYSGSSAEVLSDKHGTSVETLKDLVSDVNNNMQSSPVSLSDQESTIPTSSTEYTGRQTHQNRFLTPSQISYAIAASKRSRLFCSVTIALLVVVSYLGYPLIGSRIVKSIISFSPLYLVLLTNLTLVLMRLLFNNGRGYGQPVGTGSPFPSIGGYDWADQAGKALEVGLVMQKAIDALFMDCSIYAVTTICGLSLVSKLAT